MPGRTGSMRTRSIHKAALTDAVTPLEESGKKLAYKAAVEGIVLLENDGSLPLKAGKIALYGAGSKIMTRHSKRVNRNMQKNSGKN